MVGRKPVPVEQPLALIAYTRELPKVRSDPSTPSEAVFVWEALISPSLPCPAKRRN